MKKNVRDFINYLIKETTITVDIPINTTTQKERNIKNQPVHINVLGIKDGTLGIAILSCGHKSCKEIIGVEILWHDQGIEFCNAVAIQNEIRTALPSLSVELRNVKDLE
jgi:hypothetical protein